MFSYRYRSAAAWVYPNVLTYYFFRKFRHERFIRQHIPPWRRAPDLRWQSSGRYGRALGSITHTGCPSHCIFREVASVIDCSRFVPLVIQWRENSKGDRRATCLWCSSFFCVKRSGTQHHAYVRNYRKFPLLKPFLKNLLSLPNQVILLTFGEAVFI